MQGILRTKVTVHCSACGSPLVRKIEMKVNNNPEEIAAAKVEMKARAMKPYTCRVCASILNS